MMVTFVSQCEKKALSRTRRVLDAFANRIGDNTWQTIITEDGLIAVKQLLRKTVTKNTAVSCHWIRSRSRSELVWIVGNRNKFNKEGFVPVNSTSKELFMDVSNIKPQAGVLYANTHYQPLIEHLFAVGYVAQQLCLQLLSDNEEKEKFAFSAFVAGCLHDIGKIDPQFQAWVTKDKSKTFIAEDGQHIDDAKFSFDKHPRHNEISLLLYQLLDRNELKSINGDNKKTIKHAILWHHAKPFRKDGDYTHHGHIYEKLIGNLRSPNFSDLFLIGSNTINKVSELEKKYRETTHSKLTACIDEKIDNDLISSLGDINLPTYKNYQSYENIGDYIKSVKFNALNNVIRACLITADRQISKLDAPALARKIEKNSLNRLVDNALLSESTLASHIDYALAKFTNSERTQKQHETAIELLKTKDIAVLAGAAGCGKTKIALEWAKLKDAKKIIWVCPRVQVCQGIYEELTDFYMPDASIEILTGEFKFLKVAGKETPTTTYFSGDIVVTTIDQILGAIITHTNVDSLIDFLNSHIVFDEYHEYVNMPAFNLLFAELIWCKKLQRANSNTLLVSATPHYFYLKELLEIDKNDVIAMPSFNPSLYQLNFVDFDEAQRDETNPLYQQQTQKSFVISNTAQTAQLSFIRNQQHENCILLHSKFKRKDKIKWFKEVFDSFKKEGTEKFNVLRSGPIVQASLNITCDYMVTEITNAENTLQRLGRLNRFGLNNQAVNILTIAVPLSIAQGKGTGKAARFLARMNSFASTKAWYELLRSQEDYTFTLPQLYALYERFYDSANAQRQKTIESDLIAALKKSVHLINKKVIDPIVIPPKKAQTENRAKISKSSLRGDNRFVQMAVCDVNNPSQPVVLDSYAYDFPIRDDEEFDNLTASCDEIEGYGDSNKNLLSHMMKKHHNIKGISKAHKDFILLNEARSPESPIYLSYTPSDLDKVGGKSAQHNEAIYYAVCEKQPIGAIAMKQLLNNSEE